MKYAGLSLTVIFLINSFAGFSLGWWAFVSFVFEGVNEKQGNSVLVIL